MKILFKQSILVALSLFTIQARAIDFIATIRLETSITDGGIVVCTELAVRVVNSWVTASSGAGDEAENLPHPKRENKTERMIAGTAVLALKRFTRIAPKYPGCLQTQTRRNRPSTGSAPSRFLN